MKLYESLFARGIVTILFPRYYFKRFLGNNKNKTDWRGKKACFTLSFDIDYTEDMRAIPSLLDTLSSYSFKACFACIGKFIEKYPEEHARIIEQGHEIVNHTYTHPDNEEWNPNQRFNELTIEQQKEEIAKFDEVCKNILNYKPMGFRTPHFGRLHSETVYTILEELDYKYSSSTVAIRTPNFGLPFMKENILEIPLSPCPKHPFGVFDSYHSFERGGGWHKKDGVFFRLFKELIQMGISTNSYINVYWDPQDIMKLNNFKNLLDYIEERQDDIWIATYQEVAEWWLKARQGGSTGW